MNKKIKAVLIAGGGILLLITILTFLIPHVLIKKGGPYSYALYDWEGRLLGAQVASDEQWRFEGSEVPEKFARAIVTFEDKRFYRHPGVDVFSIVRAYRANRQQGRIVSGGSTITMQTVRILEKNPKRTILQKIHEAISAVFLELRYSKKKILELYCANAPFGGNVVGLEAASWRYFNMPPERLTWAEAATLAVLPNQPSIVFPGADNSISTPRLKKKRDDLLLKMHELGYLSEDELELSLDEKLPGKPYSLPAFAPHYLEFLKKTDKKKTKFYTSMDSRMQKNTTRLLEEWSYNFSRRGINNGAALILNTETGEVLAYVGNTGMNGRNNRTRAVDVVQAKRSSGSLLKPFLYAAMLDSGQLLPQQMVVDVPIRIGNYRPDNNIPVYRGIVPADEALSRSLNIPAIRELREYGLNAFLDFLRKSGFTTLNRPGEEYGLPLILGGGEITLWEAAHAYASFMNCANGNLKKWACSRGNAWLTMEALKKGTRPEDEANWELFADSKQISWKTGTSSGNRDCWAVGTTNEYTVAVWIGNAEGNGTPELKSVSTAAPVMFDIFTSLPSTTWPEAPYGHIKQTLVCADSGYCAGPDCVETKYTYTAKSSPQGKMCPYCRKVSFTPDGKYQATAQDLTGPAAGKYDGTVPLIKKCFVLPPSLELWYKKSNINYKVLPEFVSWHNSMQADELSVIFPEPYALVIIPVEIDGTQGSMVMQAASRSKQSTIFWDVDGNFLGTTNGVHELKITPKPGRHKITITDEKGNSAVRVFEVVDEE